MFNLCGVQYLGDGGAAADVDSVLGRIMFRVFIKKKGVTGVLGMDVQSYVQMHRIIQLLALLKSGLSGGEMPRLFCCLKP